MPFFASPYGELIGKILLSAILGGIVGLERVWSGHAAGLRTNILIAMSSCIFTILSIGGFPIANGAGSTTQIAGQIVTGVGFLGAGAIFHAKTSTLGFTTAASIWLVAAIGMAVGSGNAFLALFSTLVALVVLAILAPVSDWIEVRNGLSHGTAPSSGTEYNKEK